MIIDMALVVFFDGMCLKVIFEDRTITHNKSRITKKISRSNLPR